jgi:ornithine carbamoyltransferase
MQTENMQTLKHLPDITSFSEQELKQVLKLAFEMKKNPAKYAGSLNGKSLVMWFEKPSLRTRLSFEIGMAQLGGHAVYLDVKTTHKGKAVLKDEMKCMSRYADIMMARVFEHATIEEMMACLDVPLINGLSDLSHPCQALADVMTIQEFVKKDAVVAYLGDGNNVCNSLISACRMLGMKIKVATPKAYPPKTKPDFWSPDPEEAVKGADVVYTDTWVSMGDEADTEKRIKALLPYQVNKKLLGDCFFMHCLPAIRGKEVTDEVMDSGRSLVYEQAENRLHAQKAVLLTLLCKASVHNKIAKS